ncbi:MAG: helix-turn-helix transcriptional regulator [Alphaproteobacteria bacterium]
MNLNIPSNLSADQAADILGIAKSTLSKLRLSGEGPAFIKMGRRVAYRPEDLELWVNQNRRQSTSDLGGNLG